MPWSRPCCKIDAAKSVPDPKKIETCKEEMNLKNQIRKNKESQMREIDNWVIEKR